MNTIVMQKEGKLYSKCKRFICGLRFTGMLHVSLDICKSNSYIAGKEIVYRLICIGISNTEEYILLNTFLTCSYIIFSECATCHSAMQLIISTVITPNLHPYTTEAKTGIKDILPFDSCHSHSLLD